MFIDTHLHVYPYSSDSFMSLEELVAQAKKIGLNGICITDHESMEVRKAAQKISQEEDFLIIVGAEFLTDEGDMTVFGVAQLPAQKVSAQDLVDLVNEQGGVAISAHPFRQNNRGMGQKIKRVHGLHGVEAFNGSTPLHHNLQAYHLGTELKLAALGGSDAHTLQQVGKFATYFRTPIRNEADFIEAVKKKSTSPVMLKDYTYISPLNSFHMTSGA
jgi:predicted metal-dependent phosphoesterase TrpH